MMLLKIWDFSTNVVNFIKQLLSDVAYHQKLNTDKCFLGKKFLDNYFLAFTLIPSARTKFYSSQVTYKVVA